MKKILLFAVVALLLGACKKEEISLFDMVYRKDFSIQAGLSTIDNHHFRLTNIPSNSDTLFTVHSVTLEDITSITPKSARLTAIFANVDYSFLFNVSVRIFKDDPDVYREIFYRDNVPANTGDFLDLIPTLVDVKEYMKDEKINIDVVLIRPRTTPSAFIETRLDFSFEVK